MHGLRHASDQWEAPSWLNQCHWSAWFSKHCLFMFPQMGIFKSKELKDISSGMFRAPWTSWEKTIQKWAFWNAVGILTQTDALCKKVAFTFVVCFFLEYKPICPFYICPASQFTTWQLGQIPPIWDLKRANGRSASDFISLVCDNLSVLLLTFYFSFVSALCVALRNIWFMHSNRLCIIVVCDTKLPINLLRVTVWDRPCTCPQCPSTTSLMPLSPAWPSGFKLINACC